MGVATLVTKRFADPTNPRSSSAKARARRWSTFAGTFGDISRLRVLDLGGTSSFWVNAPVRPAHVTLVNLDPERQDLAWLRPVVGDACEFGVGRDEYDLTVSNSLLEHVGGHAQRQRLAEVINVSAPRHWVQTPYRYFPVEPHWVFPMLQFLPFPAQVRAVERWPVGHLAGRGREDQARELAHTELVGRAQMRMYFPGSRLWAERWCGLTKSLTAIRA